MTDTRRVGRGHAAEGCLSSTRIRTQLYLECYCACRRYQDCHCGERRLRYVAVFVGQLSDKPLLASTILCGVSGAKNNGVSKNYVLICFDNGVAQWCGRFE